MSDAKEHSVDLLLDHRRNKKDMASKEVFINNLLPVIDDYELLGLDIVQTYNGVAKELAKMYNEIIRLNLWNLISKEKDSLDYVETVTLIKKDGDKGILNAKFQDKKKINTYLGYVKKKSIKS